MTEGLFYLISLVTFYHSYLSLTYINFFFAYIRNINETS